MAQGIASDPGPQVLLTQQDPTAAARASGLQEGAEQASHPGVLTPRKELEETRSLLGDIVTLDLTALELPAAHHALGSEVGSQVRDFLDWKVNALGEGRILTEIRSGRKAAHALRQRLQVRPPRGLIRTALERYLECLAAWAEGADLERAARGLLGRTPVDGEPVIGEDLAFLLQAELTGCQTGVMREAGGTVVLWHTEEDHDHPGRTRFDRLRLARFRSVAGEPSRAITAFIYPDLLPGPAFGWSELDYAQAVDAYYLGQTAEHSGVAANAATWVSLFLAGSRTIAQIARAMAPFRDGYAMSALSLAGGQLRARTTEFVGDTVAYTSLSPKPGGFRTQVNLITGWAARSSRGRENIEPWRRRAQERRMARAQRFLRSLEVVEDLRPGLRRLLASRVGGSWAYANPAVRAHFLCRLTAAGLEVEVGAGPAPIGPG